MTTETIISTGASFYYRDPRSPHYTTRGTIEAIGDANILKYPYRMRLENGQVAWAATIDLIPIGPAR